MYLETEEIKKIELDIMDEIELFSKERHVEYSIFFGSLLGAVRHHGFIPWDDDMDIVVFRNDYERMLKEFNDFSQKYKIVYNENTANYPYHYAKIVARDTDILEYKYKKYDGGVFIDVFPLDNIESLDKAKEIQNKIKKYKRILDYKMHSLKWEHKRKKLMYAIKILTFFIPSSYFVNRITKLSTSYKDVQTEYVAYLGTDFDFSSKNKRIFKKDIFKNMQSVKFEDRYYKAVNDPDVVLRGLYGNYMELPPEESRKSEHSFDIWMR